MKKYVRINTDTVLGIIALTLASIIIVLSLIDVAFSYKTKNGEHHGTPDISNLLNANPTETQGQTH